MLEYSKTVLKKEGDNENIKHVIFFVLVNYLKLIHPTLPYVTEELY
jgi:valyl-tRNA synthetase